MKWTIETDDRGTVRLTGEEPNGYPCETYLNGELLERSEDGSFAWATETGVPTPVFQIDRTIERFADDPDRLSYMLDLEVRGLWEKLMNQTEHSDALRARTSAYVQYARDRHLELCGKPMKRFDLYH